MELQENDSVEEYARAHPDLLEAEIRRLVKEGYPREAKELAEKTPEGLSPGLDKLRRFLAYPPRTFRSPATGKNFAADFKWIEEHYHEYQGQWVAIKDGALVDSDPSHKALQERLENEGRMEEGTLFFKA